MLILYAHSFDIISTDIFNYVTYLLFSQKKKNVTYLHEKESVRNTHEEFIQDRESLNRS